MLDQPPITHEKTVVPVIDPYYLLAIGIPLGLMLISSVIIFSMVIAAGG